MNVGLSNSLRTVRNIRGMTQQQLADLCDISVQTVQKIENGIYSPKLVTAFLFCMALKCTIYDLFTLEYDDEDEATIDTMNAVTRYYMEHCNSIGDPQ